jgi:hypothetical protein
MPLVDYEEQRSLLKLDPGTDEAFIGDLLDEATALFEGQCGRTKCPFSKAIPARVEILDARPGSNQLWLDYPIAVVSSIALGRNVEAPDETLAPANADQVVWRAGERILTRTDGGLWEANSPLLSFARGGAWPDPQCRARGPSWVKVVYDTQADLPKDAKLAVMRAAAAVYNQRGLEGLTNKSAGDESQSVTATFAMFADSDPAWKLAVENNKHHVYR